MAQHAYKLTTATMGIFAEGDHEIVLTIPANAMVVLMDGDTEGTGFVRVRYRDKILSMFAVDLRTRGEAVREESA